MVEGAGPNQRDRGPHHGPTREKGSAEALIAGSGPGILPVLSLLFRNRVDERCYGDPTGEIACGPVTGTGASGSPKREQSCLCFKVPRSGARSPCTRPLFSSLDAPDVVAGS